MKSQFSSYTRRAPRTGFTIIELLVAVGITALLVTLMLTIVTNVLSGWTRSSGSLSSGNQARTILSQLSQDLQSLVVRRDSNVWFTATVLPDNFSTNGSNWSGTAPKPGASSSLSLLPPGTNPQPDLSTYRFGQSGVWLRFFTVRPDSNGSTYNISAPRAVSYQIVRSKVGNAGTSYIYQIYRAEARPGPVGTGTNSTFNSGYNLFMAAGNPSYNTPDNSVDPTSNTYNVGVILKPALAQLIGNNVIDFGVRVWTADPSSNAPVFPGSSTNTGFAATIADGTNGTTKAVSPLGEVAAANMTYGFPVVVEVMVRILTDDGAQQITNLESGKITGDWWTIALANSQVYTRRIEIKSQAF